MSLKERTGKRDLTYSRWHRLLPKEMSAVNIDWVEYLYGTNTICAFVEDSAYTGESSKRKCNSVTNRAAEDLGIESWILLFEVENGFISRFFAKETNLIKSDWTEYSLDGWALELKNMRQRYFSRKQKSVPVKYR